MTGAEARREVARIRRERRALALIRHLRRRGVMHIEPLVKDLRIPKSTLEEIIKLLKAAAITSQPREGWHRLHPDLGYLVGVDITHGQANIVVSDLNYEPKGRTHTLTG